jgi:hypothetical protein
VLLGLLGGRERFDQLTGQHTRVGHVIAGFGQGPCRTSSPRWARCRCWASSPAR